VVHFERIVHRLSQGLDRVAGWAIVALMALVIANVGLRRLGHPIPGTYEFVCFSGAIIVGLAIAYCAVQKGHIAVTMVTDRLPQRTQAVIDTVIGIISVVFIGLVTWQLGLYATSMVISGEVSPTMKMPFFIIIYLVGFGFLMLGLVFLVDLLKSVTKVAKK